MKHVFKIFFLLVISLFSLTLSAQNKALEVLKATPQGDTKYYGDSKSIVVSFSEHMVNLAATDTNVVKKDYFSFNINITGTYQWLDTKTLMFTPAGTIPYATEVVVTVKRGIKALSGNVLKKDFVFSFNTVTPDIQNHMPYNREKDVSIDPPIYIIFNMDMSLKSVNEKLVVKEDGKAIKYNIRYFTEEDKDKIKYRVTYVHGDLEEYDGAAEDTSKDKVYYKEFVITPEKPFAKNAKISVEVASGVMPLKGNVGMRTPKSFYFQTHKDFAYTGSTVQSVNADYQPDRPHISFATKINQREFYKNIEISPKVQMPDMDDEDWNEDWASRSYSLYTLEFNAETTYTITLKKGMTDIHEQKLDKDIVIKLHIGSYNPYYNMPTGTGVVEAYEGRKIPLSVINPNQIRIESRVLNKDEIVPYLILNGAVYGYRQETREYMAYKSKYKNLLTYANTDVFEPKVATNKVEIVPLYLTNHMGKSKYGLVALRLSSYVGYDSYDKTGKAYIQVTDMGVTGKFSAEKNTIFVTELKTGKPIAGASVEIRDDFNNILAKTTTDKDGVATTDGWYNLKIKDDNRWENPRQWVIVTNGDDVAYIHSEWGTGVDPWRMNIDYTYNQKYPQLSTSMTTERGLYKPGEEIHIKGIIRENINGDWEVPKVIPKINYIVKNSRGDEIEKGVANINEYGTFLIDTKTAKDAPTGFYNIFAEGEGVGAYLSFRVQEFKTLEFETKLWAEDKEYILGDNVPIRISGRYLFGEPMPNKEVYYFMTLNENYYEPPNNQGFRFTPLRWYEDVYYPDYDETLSRDTGMLNEKGEYAVNTFLTATRDIHSAMLNIEATVLGEDNQRVSARKSVFINGSDFYFGLRRDGYFVEKNKEVSVDVIAAKPDGERISGINGYITVKRVYWESVRKAVSGGRFQWFSEKVIEEVALSKIITTENPLSYTFTPKDTGLYIITITGEDGRKNEVKAEEYMYVVGQGYSPWAMYDDDLLELVVEKENYKPNETARIMLKSPYEEATAFITVEREYVIDRYIQYVKGTSALIDVPIKSEYLPNVYVGVALIKGRVEDKSYTNYGSDLGKPSFKIGYAPLKVSPEERALVVKIDKSHAEREPGDKMSIGINVSRKDGKPVESELMVAVADIGVLNLIGFKTPNWFNYFYGIRPMNVKTADTRLHMIGQRNYGEKGENAGGGGDDGAVIDASMKAMAEALGMDVFSFRKNFLSTAFYAGQLKTDAKGNAKVEFNLPDNITSFRIMVTAVDKGSYFGANDDIVVVKKNLMLLPTLPQFAVVGDSFSAGATLYNYSGKDLDITVTASGDNINIDNPSRIVNIKGGSFEDIRFDFETKDAGEAVIRIAAKGGEHTDAVENKMKITSPRVSESVAVFESMTNMSVTNKMLIPSESEVYSGDIITYLSPSAFSELTGGIDYLITYPYGCLEQKISKIYPIVTSGRLIVDMKLTEYTEAYLDSLVNVVLKEVADYQNANGGFSYWTSKTYVSPWLTSYAAFVLLKAKENGYAVNQTVIDKAMNYLAAYAKGQAGRNPLYSADYVANAELAYIAGILAMGGKTDKALISRLYKNRDSLPFYGLANLLKAMSYSKADKKSMDNVRQIMLNTLKEDAATAHYESEEKYYDMLYIHSSAVRDTAIGLTAFIESGYDDKINDKIIRWLTQSRLGNGSYLNTQDNVSVFYAMNEYFKKYESVNPNYKAEFIIEGKKILSETFASRNDASVSKTTSVFDYASGQNEVIVQRNGEGRLYYGVRMNYAPKGVMPAKDNGIKVQKVYTTMDGKVVKNGKFKQGVDYKVTLTVTMPYQRNFVVVDDPVPAGFRVLDATFDTESSAVREATGPSGNQRHWWWGRFNHVENYNDKVILFGDVLTKGTHTYTYVVRAATPGDFILINTKAEEMYNPDVFGLSQQGRIIIEPK